MLFSDADVVYWEEGNAVYWDHGKRFLNASPVFRIGYPEFKKEPVSPACPNGVCVRFEGQIHWANGFDRACHVGPSLK